MKHYDYMCVRSSSRRECKGRYCRFGWRYVPDDSERGGRMSFRRDASSPERTAYDVLQRRSDAKAEEIDKIRDKCRIFGCIMSAIVAVFGFFAMSAGLEMLLGGAPRTGGAVAVVGALCAAPAYIVGKAAYAAAMRATGKRRMRLSGELAALLAEAEKIGYSY